MPRRKRKPAPLIAIIIIVIAIAAFAYYQGALTPATPPAHEKNETIKTNYSELLPSDNSSLRIAAFNIQVFGKSKASDPLIMGNLSIIARSFDIMAIEEIRDSEGEAFPALLDSINALEGPDYEGVIGPRLGRTSSKEQYAFIYDPSKASLIDPPALTYPDSEDLFHREPLMARFSTDAGDFVLIVIHTDPDETRQEMADLPKAIDFARAAYPDERDFILMGDMNADCSYFDPGSDMTELRNASFTWLIGDDADTTVKSTDCAYDRIIYSGGIRPDSSGILRYDDLLDLNQSQAEGISDHYPVWLSIPIVG